MPSKGLACFFKVSSIKFLAELVISIFKLTTEEKNEMIIFKDVDFFT